jgi:hypothetical protein
MTSNTMMKTKGVMISGSVSTIFFGKRSITMETETALMQLQYGSSDHDLIDEIFNCYFCYI